MPDPGRIIVAGDWHGNTRWAVSTIEHARDLLEGEDEKIIIQLGDFGIMAGFAGKWYLHTLSMALKTAGVKLRFLDGNHDNFSILNRFDTDTGSAVSPGIVHLSRGLRWQWHGRTWLALGGASSIDRRWPAAKPERWREEGVSWWPDEEISEQQAAEVTSAGHADVMLTHDCPSSVVHSFSRGPVQGSDWNSVDVAATERHRERLQGIVDIIRPSYLAHGHMHRAYTRPVLMPYGKVTVTGMACDGMDNSFAILDTRTMEWEAVQPCSMI